MLGMEKRAESDCGRGGYSRPVILIEVVGGESGKCLFDGADEAVLVPVTTSFGLHLRVMLHNR